MGFSSEFFKVGFVENYGLNDQARINFLWHSPRENKVHWASENIVKKLIIGWRVRNNVSKPKI